MKFILLALSIILFISNAFADYSKNPDDLAPVRGSIWVMEYTTDGYNNEPLEFGYEVTTDADGYVYLDAHSTNGSGVVYYGQSPWSGNTGFCVSIQWDADFYLQTDIYDFSISGNDCAGYYSYAITSGGTTVQSLLYDMTGYFWDDITTTSSTIEPSSTTSIEPVTTTTTEPVTSTSSTSTTSIVPTTSSTIEPSSTSSIEAATTTTTEPGTSTSSTSTTTTACPAQVALGDDTETLARLHAIRRSLAKSATGRRLIAAYYRLAPRCADIFETNPLLRRITAATLQKISTTNQQQF